MLFLFLFSTVIPSFSHAKDLEKAKALNKEVVKLMKQGQYADAIPLAKESIAITEKAFGPKHPKTATGLNQLALLYMSTRAYRKAEPLYKRALAIWEKALGPEHRFVAIGLVNLASLHRKQGNYAGAEPLYKRAVSIMEKALGPQHRDLGTALNNLAMIYTSTGKYAKAEALYKRALAIWEKALGPEHRFVAKGLGNLAALYYEQGEYAKAEPLYQRAIRLKEKRLGPEHPRLASTLSNLAVLYKYQGEYARAEPLYKRALAIQEKALKSDDPSLATTLNNLAEFYNLLGYYAKAEPLFERALAIREKVLGPKHPSLAVTLDNLGSLYYHKKDYRKSAGFYKKGLAIWKAVLGPEHAEVATNLNNIAGVYFYLGDHDKAIAHYKEAIAIWRKALGGEHPKVAMGLNNLAEMYYVSGNYEGAEPIYAQALSIREKGLGSEHPLVASNLDDLAGVYAATGRFAQAHALYLRSEKITNKVIDQVMGFTSETQKMQFIHTKKWSLFRALNLIFQYLGTDRAAIKDAMDMWLKRKGIVLEAQRRFQEALVYSDDREAVKVFQALSQVRAHLSRLAFGGPGKEGADAYKKRIADLEMKKERLEARLSKISQAFALKQKIARADSEKVAKALPANTALLEFARVRKFNFKAKGKEKKWGPAHYLVFVLHAGKGEKVGMIDLGDAQEIDKAVALFKKEITNIRDLKGTKAMEWSRKIYALVFAPIKRELGEVKEVFISPDGNLNLIPFEALQRPDGRFIIEDYRFNYLAAGRDLLGFGEIRGRGGKALLIGDPDFDMGEAEKRSMLRKLALSGEGGKEISRRSSEMRGFHFSRLPASREEVKAIQAILGKERAELYTGAGALEEVLMGKKSPSILHLATHGFFLSDLDLGDFAGDRGRRGPGTQARNPLLRSGIALAGANHTLKSGDRGKSGGIVTAEKILGMRLRGTHMVVLSACETGLGEVKTGEGVFGLRRAFTQAGSRSLVMSMWSVPDRETKELMIAFYSNIQSGGMNRSQALRKAVLKEMQIVKKRYGTLNPLFWGAFVFLGEP